MTASVASAAKVDRRSLRTQLMLRRALAEALNDGEDLTRITVAGLTDRAGLTRRTFYTHFKDIPDFVEQVESGVLADIRQRIDDVVATNLSSLYRNIDELEPAPGSVELLDYLKRNGELIGALLGPGGDPAFGQRICAIAREAVAGRMKTGIFPGVLGTFFDYYLSYVVSAEMGIVQRWFATGLVESPETMARIMTVVAFVRPGDLYGKPIDINVPEYGMKLLGLNVRAPRTESTDTREDIDG
ncbi:TetR-like C-terminal domain-containing protein [Collinsella sp. An2]|uniref:TetR/AcrR family transcriptional regulator n=1 Tax=Collinsella sp. An2 TaxID=1965585 RepID=UPI0031B86194